MNSKIQSWNSPMGYLPRLLGSPLARAARAFPAVVLVGLRRELYFLRDQRGLEVDFVVPAGAGRLALVEAMLRSVGRGASAQV
ncbi:MAG: hypothetical protein IT514_10555 [Burkholderiales bacterium]|nr:hypothetical protein [Burkholderiales bacterium]